MNCKISSNLPDSIMKDLVIEIFVPYNTRTTTKAEEDRNMYSFNKYHKMLNISAPNISPPTHLHKGPSKYKTPNKTPLQIR